MRTTINVVVLTVVFVLVVLLSFWYLTYHVRNEFVARIERELAAVQLAGVIDVRHASTDEYPYQRMALVVCGVALTAAAFGLLLAHISLAPIRQSRMLQRRFLSNVAHELRSPLATLRTSTEVLLLTSTIPKEAREVLEANLEEYSRITTILNNLLSVSVLYSPQNMAFTQISMALVAERSAHSLRSLATNYGVAVEVVGDTKATVWGDETALEQLCTHLIRNGILFSDKHAGKTVRVDVAHQGSTVALTITDEGIGIHPNELPYVMEPFYKGDTSRTTAPGTRGLGLTIAYEIVKSHNATIRIESVPKVGTRVAITLPVDRREATATDKA